MRLPTNTCCSIPARVEAIASTTPWLLAPQNSFLSPACARRYGMHAVTPTPPAMQIRREYSDRSPWGP